MSVVQELYERTKELHSALHKEITSENRDEVVAKIVDFLDKREELITELKGPYSDEEKTLGQELIKYNEEIDSKLIHLKNDILLDLKKLKQGKKSNKGYANPYHSVSIDGRFFDKRN